MLSNLFGKAKPGEPTIPVASAAQAEPEQKREDEAQHFTQDDIDKETEKFLELLLAEGDEWFTAWDFLRQSALRQDKCDRDNLNNDFYTHPVINNLVTQGKLVSSLLEIPHPYKQSTMFKQFIVDGMKIDSDVMAEILMWIDEEPVRFFDSPQHGKATVNVGTLLLVKIFKKAFFEKTQNPPYTNILDLMIILKPIKKINLKELGIELRSNAKIMHKEMKEEAIAITREALDIIAKKNSEQESKEDSHKHKNSHSDASDTPSGTQMRFFPSNNSSSQARGDGINDNEVIITPARRPS